MLVTLSAPTWDPSGYVEIHALDSQTRGETVRRVERRPTIDGGSVVVDQGSTDADRTLDLRWQPVSKAQEETIEEMVQLYTRLKISINGAVYETAPESYTPGDAESSLRLLVVSKLSA